MKVKKVKVEKRTALMKCAQAGTRVTLALEWAVALTSSGGQGPPCVCTIASDPHIYS